MFDGEIHIFRRPTCPPFPKCIEARAVHTQTLGSNDFSCEIEVVKEHNIIRHCNSYPSADQISEYARGERREQGARVMYKRGSFLSVTCITGSVLRPLLFSNKTQPSIVFSFHHVCPVCRRIFKRHIFLIFFFLHCKPPTQFPPALSPSTISAIREKRWNLVSKFSI